MNAAKIHSSMLNDNTKLFDIAGRSSLGSLPRGELRIASVPVTSASSNTTNTFTIGSEESQRMNSIQEASQYDARRSESFMRMQNLSKPGTSFLSPRELRSDDRMLTHYRETLANLQRDPEQKLSHLPSTEEFLNQATINPIRNLE